MSSYAQLSVSIEGNLIAPDGRLRLGCVGGAQIEGPRYMPVVRDLSDAKKEKLITWLKAGAPSA